MKNINKNLQIEQLDRKIKAFNKLENITRLSDGWVHSARTALGMSLSQLGGKLGITAQSVKEIEQREKNGSISLKNLKEVARALNLKLVYGFSAPEKSLSKIIKNQAYHVAENIVARTNRTMQLEKQANSSARIKRAIKDRASEIIANQPRHLWD